MIWVTGKEVGDIFNPLQHTPVPYVSPGVQYAMGVWPSGARRRVVPLHPSHPQLQSDGVVLTLL